MLGVHATARVHVIDDTATDHLAEFRRINVQGTLHLARQAAAAAVQRFVFISSIKVNGEATKLGMPFSADDLPAPLDPCGISNMEAEHGMRSDCCTNLHGGGHHPPAAGVWPWCQG